MTDRPVKILFGVGIGLSSALIIALLIVYFVQFNGELSPKISDWADFGTFIYSFATVGLTFLNVCLFYQLTKSANEINSHSQETSTGIIDTYTKEEQKRSYASTGTLLMQEYKKAQAELINLLNDTTSPKLDYRAIRVAVCQLETIYEILHQSEQIFPTLHIYQDHDEYIKELRGIANDQQEEPAIIQGNPEQIRYRQINGLRNHHKNVIGYFEEVMNCIKEDLGRIYVAENEANR